MKNFIILLAALLPLCSGASLCRGRDTVTAMFWNLENFFDPYDGGASDSDREFSSAGERHWTYRRYHTKALCIAKTILYIQSSRGRLPDVIGFAEVENRSVLRHLLGETPLRMLDYEIVHYDSRDPRGIDCALLYRRGRLRLCRSTPVPVTDRSGDTLPTRDILLCEFICAEGDSLAVMVNHHPSKYSGAVSESRREAAVRTMLSLSLRETASGWENQLSMGDFNDTPSSGLFDVLPPQLNNISGTSGSGGSIRFDGRWELIDQAFVTGRLVDGSRVEVVGVPFLTVRDSSHSGQKPRRTYSGPRYLGGVSDHYPILVCVDL